MKQILIIGGGGMVGQKLAAHLAAHSPADEVTLYDIGFPEGGAPAAHRLTGNLADPEQPKMLAKRRPDVIFHLAAIVSGEGETNFEKGWATNMMACWNLLEGLRSEHEASGGAYVPRLVFSSSIAVFGAPFPDQISDTFFQTPATSYGAQKAISELMITDFSRKGYVDGVSIRLPTLCVRPGKPNLAASSFFSGIIREPLNGQEARLPVADTVRHWHATPRSAVGFLTHAATLDTDRLEGRRALNMPGVSCTVAEQIEALRRIAGQKAVDLIRVDPDPAIIKIVAGWARDFAPERATALGFQAEATFDEIIQQYIDDELS